MCGGGGGGEEEAKEDEETEEEEEELSKKDEPNVITQEGLICDSVDGEKKEKKKVENTNYK